MQPHSLTYRERRDAFARSLRGLTEEITEVLIETDDFTVTSTGGHRKATNTDSGEYLGASWDSLARAATGVQEWLDSDPPIPTRLLGNDLAAAVRQLLDAIARHVVARQQTRFGPDDVIESGTLEVMKSSGRIIERVIRREFGEVDSLAGPQESAHVTSSDQEEAADPIAHAPDFTWLRVRERVYNFKKGQQAEVIRLLYEAWEASGRNDGCGLAEATLAEELEAGTGFRIEKVFARHEAKGTILRSPSKGVWALYLNDE